MKKELTLGCIGDDFTGSSDAASFLVNAGMNTILINGIQEELPDIDCDAIVVALKTRSIEKSKAVEESLATMKWLEQKGAKHLYIKYCSTFDSTKEGNIGPVTDAALEKYNESCTILCPALPINKRIVKNGELWVDGVLLADSAMKNHPLNPMWASDLADLIKPQGKYPCLKIPYTMLEEKSVEELKAYIEEFKSKEKRFYIIPDYITEEHGKKIAQLFAELKILTGGSGILAELAKVYKKEASNKVETVNSAVKGRGLILAGSCSKATLSQIEAFKEYGRLSYKIDPIKLLNNEESVDDIWNFISANPTEDILIYSSATPEAVKENQKYGREKIASIIENTIAELGKRAFQDGVKRIIVAGGETSGAVTLALGFNAFIIGKSISPGVPVMIPVKNQDIRLVLKSGNFGEREFFINALAKTKG